MIEIDLDLDRETSPLVQVDAGLEIETAGDGDLPAFLFEAGAYATHYTEASDQDQMGADLRAGPMLTFGENRLRPFAEITHQRFDDDPYATSFAGGLEYWRASSAKA